MATLKDFAQTFEVKGKLKNIAELQSVSMNIDIKHEAEAEFPYDYIIVDDERYKVPTSVTTALKSILEENPNLQTFKVKKSGDGMDTRYVVIPLS